MTKDQLMESAKKLQQPPNKIAEEYAQKRDLLVAVVNRIMSNREDLNELIGKQNHTMMEDNHNNHARFMDSIFHSYDPQTLVETVLWVFRAYRSHGFHQTYWSAQLNAWLQAIHKELSEEAFLQIETFYNWLIVNIPAFIKLSEES